MRKKFLKGVITRCENKCKQPYDKNIAILWANAMELDEDEDGSMINEGPAKYSSRDAIDDHSQAHGEGRLQKKEILTAYCGACDNIERYQQLEVVDGVLNCTKCKAKIKLNANNIVYSKAKTCRFTAYEEQHSKGFISIENLVEVVDNLNADADLGIQIAEDGRVWICIDGISFLRFKPKN